MELLTLHATGLVKSTLLDKLGNDDEGDMLHEVKPESGIPFVDFVMRTGARLSFDAEGDSGGCNAPRRELRASPSRSIAIADPTVADSCNGRARRESEILCREVRVCKDLCSVKSIFMSNASGVILAPERLACFGLPSDVNEGADAEVDSFLEFSTLSSR